MRAQRAMVLLAVGKLAFGYSDAAMAVPIELTNPDFQLRWDNTLRYTLGMRTEGQDRRIMNNPNYDESDGKFDKNDIVTNRVDLLTEVDFSYRKEWGARLSAAGWYDQAYHNDSVHSNVPGFQTSYDNDHYSSEVKRYVEGPSGEILDAFLWKNLRVGDSTVNVKIGRHTNYWGEGLLFGAHAIFLLASTARRRQGGDQPGHRDQGSVPAHRAGVRQGPGHRQPHIGRAVFL